MFFGNIMKLMLLMQLRPSGGTTCVSSCAGVADGNYHSCNGCDRYASCAGGVLYDDRPCTGGTLWNDNIKNCDRTSPTCYTAGVSAATDGPVTNAGNCVSSCAGVADGNYHSCNGCDRYASCAGGVLYDDRPCTGGTLWNDNIKNCDRTSPTCNTNPQTGVASPSPASSPAPVTPAPVTPAPVTPSPVTPAPVTPVPVTPAPVSTSASSTTVMAGSTSSQQSPTSHGNKVVCYLPNWVQYRPAPYKFWADELDANLCTHIIVSFGNFNGDSITTSDWNDSEFYSKLQAKKSINPGLRILLAVGGWNAGTWPFENVCRSPTSLSTFSKNVVAFLRQHKFDGFDLDWEYPSKSGPSGKTMFNKLTKALYDEFAAESLSAGEEKLLLTAATAAGISVAQDSYDIPYLARTLDWINLMSYDLHGSWDPVTGHNAGLYPSSSSDTLNVESAVNYYLNAGLPSSQLVLGIGLYGRSWTLASTSNQGVGAPAVGAGTAMPYTSEAGYMAYYEVCTAVWTRVWDDVQKVPYAYSGNQWVSYDDFESITFKVDFIKAKGLGGAMFWDVTMDDFTGACDQGVNPLITTVMQRLNNGVLPTTGHVTSSTSSPLNSQSAGNRVVCYLPNWVQYRPAPYKFWADELDAQLCSHIIVAFGNFNGDSIVTSDWNDKQFYSKLQAKKADNPRLRLLLAVGGWSAGTRSFENVCRSPSSLATFSRKVVSFLRRHRFDGFDLDWEYPSKSGALGKSMFTSLAKALHDEFAAESLSAGEEKLLLTAATAAGISVAQDSYDIPHLARYLDWINLMSYDLHGSWDTVTGHNAGLYPSSSSDTLNVESAVNYYLNAGLPSSQLVLGIGLYGRSWTLASTSNQGVGAPAVGAGTAMPYTSEAGYMAYYEVCKLGWTRSWDDRQKVPYAHSGNQWVSYDDRESVAVKARFIAEKALGGAMFWDVTMDDFINTCGDGVNPLITKVKQVLRTAASEVKVAGQLRITDWKFKQSLKDSSSPEYLAYTNALCSELEAVATRDALSSAYKSCVVDSFRRGSVVAAYQLLFSAENQTMAAHELTATFSKQLLTAIQDKAAFSSLQLDITALTVEGCMAGCSRCTVGASGWLCAACGDGFAMVGRSCIQDEHAGVATSLAELSGGNHGVDLNDLLGGSLTEDEIKGLTADQLRLLDDDMLSTFMASLDTSQADTLCHYVLPRLELQLVRRLLHKGLDYLGFLSRNQQVSVGGAMCAVILDEARRLTSPAYWDLSMWTQALQLADGVQAADIATIYSATLIYLLENRYFDKLERNLRTKQDLRDAFLEVVTLVVGPVKDWTSDDIAVVGGLVVRLLPPDDLTLLDTVALEENLRELENMEFLYPASSAAFSGKRVLVMGGAQVAADWSATDIQSVGALVISDPTIVSRLNPDSLAQAAADIAKDITDRKHAFLMAPKLMESTLYGDPASLNASTLADLGPVLGSMPLSYIDQLSVSSLSKSLEKIGQNEMSSAAARSIARRLIEDNLVNPATMEADDISQAGHVMAGLDSDAWQTIPAASVAAAVGNISKLDLGPEQKIVVIRKLKETNGGHLGDSAADLGSLFQQLPRSDVQQLTYSDLSFRCSSSPISIATSRAQAHILVGTIKNTLGEPSPNNTNYTGDAVACWARIASMGFTAAELTNFRHDVELPTILDALTSYEEDMLEAQTQALSDKVRQYLATHHLDEATVQQLASFLKHLTSEELRSVNATVRPAMCAGIGTSSMHTLPLSDVQRLKTFCLQNVLRDDSGVIEDRTNQDDLDDNDVRGLGSLLCGLQETDVVRLTGAAIDKHLMEMSLCPYAGPVAKALLERVLIVKHDALNTSADVISVGPLLQHATSSVVDSIPQDALSAAFMSLVEQFEAHSTLRLIRDQSYAAERAESEVMMENAGRDYLLQRALSSLQAAEGSSARRRRDNARRTRSTDSGVACSTIASMGSSATALTPDDVSAITDADFRDCAETLGAISSWDADQLSALAARSKQVYGNDVSIWSSEELRQLGSIAGGLTTDDFALLDLSTSDVVTSLGSHDVYDSSQLSLGFSRWLSLTYDDVATEIDADDLVTLGHFACGANTQHIADIPADVFSDAASSVGALGSCEATQLQAYALLAKDVFGSDVREWQSDEITTLGDVLGGLSANDLSLLSADQISQITPTTLSRIPPAKFAGLSVTQLSSFTVSQANAVTSEQLSSLSAEQLDALADRGSVAAGGYNAASFSGANITSLCSLLCITAWMTRS